MCEPRPLQVKSRAPAAPAEPSACAWTRSASRRSSSAEAASRTCRRTVWPDAHRLADRDRARSRRSAPMIGRTRKSPRSYSGWFSSITRPSSTPGGGELALVLGQRRDRLAEALHRRLRPPARRSRCRRRLVIVISGPTGPAPCETQGRTSTPRRQHRHRAAGVRRRRRGSRTAAAREGGAGKAAEHRRPEAASARAPPAAPRPGSCMDRRGRSPTRRSWAPIASAARREARASRADGEPSSSRSAVEVHGLDLGAGQRGAPDDRRRACSSSSRPPATMPPAPQPIRLPAARGARGPRTAATSPWPRWWPEANTTAQVARAIEPGAGAVGGLGRRLDRVEALGSADRAPDRERPRRAHASWPPGGPRWTRRSSGTRGRSRRGRRRARAACRRPRSWSDGP